MNIIKFAMLLLLITAASASARPVIADLSLRQIEIDSGFKGTEVLLFGARNDAGDVVVVVRGPELSYVVRKKERVAGIWVNKKEAIFDNVNGFYVVASSRQLDGIKNDLLLSKLGIGMENLELESTSSNKIDKKEFQTALLNMQEQEKLYYPEVGEVSFIGDTLFRTIIKIPDNVLKGEYTAEVYLFSDGQLIGLQSTPLIVRKKGFDALVFDFAYQYPAIYGILAVLLALCSGWIAGAVFRKV
ncbi:MAG: hypothetical protein K0R98_1117 [Rickettsiaceae bacterium]|jgi:uncharacterized protein (TIGR02186 family)|nr:hypothetical protein [Rickettsiaceae bacterium]